MWIDGCVTLICEWRTVVTLMDTIWFTIRMRLVCLVAGKTLRENLGSETEHKSALGVKQVYYHFAALGPCPMLMPLDRWTVSNHETVAVPPS